MLSSLVVIGTFTIELLIGVSNSAINDVGTVDLAGLVTCYGIFLFVFLFVVDLTASIIK